MTGGDVPREGERAFERPGDGSSFVRSDRDEVMNPAASPGSAPRGEGAEPDDVVCRTGRPPADLRNGGCRRVAVASGGPTRRVRLDRPGLTAGGDERCQCPDPTMDIERHSDGELLRI